MQEIQEASEIKTYRSISKACVHVGVDRNTVAATAVIAEAIIAAEGVAELPPINTKQTLADYAVVCKHYIESNAQLEEKIEKMKKEGELLPIKYRFKK